MRYTQTSAGCPAHGRLTSKSTTLPTPETCGLDAYDLETLGNEPVSNVDEAWCDEIAARIADIEAGRVPRPACAVTLIPLRGNRLDFRVESDGPQPSGGGPGGGGSSCSGKVTA